MSVNRRVVLASRPEGEASAENFRLESASIPELGDGDMLVKHRYLSIDPYMRGRMNASKSYAVPQELGNVMVGATAGEVVASKNPNFKVGVSVTGMGGWQEYSVVSPADASMLRVVDTSVAPLSDYLSCLGMPGVTAWIGLHRICGIKAGETVVISAASGAVGSVAGILAREAGCKTVGIAGGPDKCAYVRDVLGFDACFDYKAVAGSADLAAALASECPSGIDAYFENVGGWITDGVMSAMNPFSRMAVCGMISGYDGAMPSMRSPGLILTNRMLVQGFIVGEKREDWPVAMAALNDLYRRGVLHTRTSVSAGLETAPSALLGLLKGKNFGKQLVELG